MPRVGWVIAVSLGVLLQAETGRPANQSEYPMIAGILADARLLRLSGEFRAAEETLSRAQRIAPRSADVYLEFAHLRKDQGDYAGLRDILDFGAEIADGPSMSVAQLQILRKNLTVLLPFDSESPFQGPPLARIATVAVPGEARAKSLSSTTTSENRNQLESNKTVNVDKVLPSETSQTDSMASVSKGSASDSTGLTADKTAEMAGVQPGLGESQNAENLSPKTSAIETPDSAGREQRVAKKTERSASSISLPTRVIPQPPKLGPINLMGVGILARAQSGSWISSGPIEREY